MRKIAIIITNPDRAGAQIVALNIMQGLIYDYQFFLITGHEGFLTEAAKKLRVKTYILPSLQRSISLRKDIICYKQLLKTLKDINPDLLHAHSSKAGVLGRIAAKRLSIPSVYTVHGWPFSPGIPYHRRIISLAVEFLLAKITSLIVVVSSFDLLLGKQMGISCRNEILLILNAVDCPTTPGIIRPILDTPRFVTVTRISRQKNLYCLIDAYALLDFEFIATIIGYGPDISSINQYIIEKKLEKKVYILGEIEKVHEELRNYDIFVLSSDWEGLPLALLEAACAGLPIISTNVGGVPDIVNHGTNGFLVDRNDSYSLAKAITTAVKTPGLVRKMGKSSKRLYEKNFSLNSMLRQYKESFDSVIQQGQLK